MEDFNIHDEIKDCLNRMADLIEVASLTQRRLAEVDRKLDRIKRRADDIAARTDNI